jgi:hypothetical protein
MKLIIKDKTPNWEKIDDFMKVKESGGRVIPEW